MPRLSGTFDLDGWEPTTITDAESGTGDAGAQLARVRITKTFHGDLEGGTSVTEIITMADASETVHEYVGMEKFTGTIDGRTGSFVLRHTARADADGASLDWRIVPGSGSGELSGISGAGGIDPSGGVHKYHLDYEL